MYLTAIDILAKYPVEAESFLHEIRPVEIGCISQHPVDRCYDLYFLNTSEHFPLVMSMQVNEELLVKAATPYLGLGGDQRLIEVFEAAHSVMLAVFAAPQNTDLTIRHIHPYFGVLFEVYTYAILLTVIFSDKYLPGFSSQSLCQTVQNRCQDSRGYHHSPFSNFRATTATAVHTIRAYPPAFTRCLFGAFTATDTA